MAACSWFSAVGLTGIRSRNFDVVPNRVYTSCTTRRTHILEVDGIMTEKLRCADNLLSPPDTVN